MKTTLKSSVGILAIVALAATMLLVGCQKKAAAPSKAANATTTELKGEITHWVWGDYEKKGAAEFAKAFPGITVNYVTIPGSSYVQKLQTTAASGGDMPDVANLEMDPRGKLVNLPIWENLDAAPYNADRSVLAPWAVRLMTNSKDQLVSVQIDNCVGGYTYNRALAKQYLGTDDPAALEKMLASWDIYLQKGKEIAQKSGGKVTLFSGADDAFRAIYGLGEYSKEAFVKDGKLNLDSSLLPVYKILAQLVKDGSIGKYQEWTPAWNASFAANTSIFYPSPSWFIGFVIKANDKEAKDKYGLISPPGGGYSWGGTSYAIPTASKNHMLSWTYIKWFTMSMEGTKSFVGVWDTPTLFEPSYKSDIYTSDANKDPVYAGQNVLAKLIQISQNPNTIVRPMTEYDQTILTANTAVLEMIAQGMSAEDAYAKLKAQIKEAAPQLNG